MSIPLRPYQEESLKLLRAESLKGHTRQVLCAPTGAGKTRIAAAITQMARLRNSRVGFFVDRVELVKQTSLRFLEVGVPHGAIGAGMTFATNSDVLICSSQTMERREHWPEFKLAFVDECHVQRKAIIKRLVSLGIQVIGLTATPFSEGLGAIYSSVTNSRTTDDLIADKVIVPIKVYCGTPVDVSDSESRKTEFTDKEASRRVVPIVGSIVSEWVTHVYREFGAPVRTLVFSATVVDGALLAKQFQAAGYRFEQVSRYDNEDERDRKIADFKSGKIVGLISCEVLSRGYDDPGVRCLVSARLYRSSLASHIQQYGRVMRRDPKNPDKTFGLVLDHVGNYLRHADATEAFWASGVDTLVEHRLESIRTRRSKPETQERQCFGCGFVMPQGAELCPSCGQARPKRRTETVQVPGRMRSYKRLTEEIPDIWPHLSALALERHSGEPERARKWALAQYKNIVGQWPRYGIQLAPAIDVHPRVRETVARLQKRYWAMQGKRRSAA